MKTDAIQVILLKKKKTPNNANPKNQNHIVILWWIYPVLICLRDGSIMFFQMFECSVYLM